MHSASHFRFCFVAAITLVAALASLACGDDAESQTPAQSGGMSGSAGASGGPPSSLSYRDYQTKVSEASCQRDLRCDAKPVADCLAKYETPEKKAQIDVFERGVNAGRIAYDATQAEAAIAAYGTFGCDQGLDVTKANNAVLRGLVTEGSECFAHAECAEVDSTLAGRRYCVDGCEFLTGETGKAGTCQQSPITTGACPSN